MDQKQYRSGYAGIRTYQQLVDAQKDLNTRKEARRDSVKTNAGFVRQFYTLGHLVQYIVESVRPMIDLVGFVVDIVNGITEKWRRRKSEVAAEPSSASAPETVEETPVEKE